MPIGVYPVGKEDAAAGLSKITADGWVILSTRHLRMSENLSESKLRPKVLKKYQSPKEISRIKMDIWALGTLRWLIRNEILLKLLLKIIAPLIKIRNANIYNTHG